MKKPRSMSRSKSVTKATEPAGAPAAAVDAASTPEPLVVAAEPAADTGSAAVVAASPAHPAVPAAAAPAGARKISLLPMAVDKGLSGTEFVRAAAGRRPVAIEQAWPPVAPWVHLAVDNARFGWYAVEPGVLRLAFHAVAFSRIGAVDRIELRFEGLEACNLTFVRDSSPRLGEANPDQGWAAMARHVIDATADIRLPAGAFGELVAIIGAAEVPMLSITIGHA